MDERIIAVVTNMCGYRTVQIRISVQNTDSCAKNLHMHDKTIAGETEVDVLKIQMMIS